MGIGGFIHYGDEFAIARRCDDTQLSLHFASPPLPQPRSTYPASICSTISSSCLLVTMTTFDVFCLLTTIDMREAELEAARKAEEAAKETAKQAAEPAKTTPPTSQVANALFTPGDAAKGGKLFQVSFVAYIESHECKLTDTSDPLRSVPHRRERRRPQGRP